MRRGRGGGRVDVCRGDGAYWRAPSALTGCALGLAGYWSGTGLQHTANHGGLAKSGFWNQFWGWLGNDVAIGKSSVEWRYHHMVSHHSYCNDADLDQDVYTALPLLRLDPSQELKWFHRYQAFYACLLYTSPSPRDLSTSRMPSSA